MAHWNNRVVRSKFPLIGGTGEEFEFEFGIREVFYNDHDEICGMTENSTAPHGETVEELKESLQRMLQACDKDVLIEEEIVYGSWTVSEDNG